MPSSASVLEALSDSDLSRKLKEQGVNVGPITDTTRPLFQKKLLRLLNKDVVSAAESDGAATGNGDNKEKDGNEPTKVDLITKGDSSESKDSSHGDGKQIESGPTVYFSVLLPEEARTQNVDCVFTDRKAALALAKKNPGSRFKLFDNLADAKTFCCPQVVPPSPKPEPKVTTKPVSDSSPFRGPKPPELSQFRRSIEAGDCDTVEKAIWRNPRFLVSSGDTPTVLQENFRYNALHVCALKGQRKAAELIFGAITSLRFLELMYPDDNAITRQKRMTFLADLYLNMPDKGLNETPLHFACKFGHIEMVQWLCAQPQTDKRRQNKYQQTPQDVTCQRVRSGADRARAAIEACLQDQCYVPLFRSVDNSTPAMVLQPLSPQALSDVMVSDVTPSPRHDVISDIGSPHQSPRTVKALAGPMSPIQAQRFRHSWTTPPSPTVAEKRRYAEIRRGDCSKGLERIGRSLAHSLKIPWSEYWEFLGDFADLSTAEGLQSLEKHLHDKFKELQQEMTLKRDLDDIDSMFSGLNLAGKTMSDNMKTPDQKRSDVTRKASSEGPQSNVDVMKDLASIFGGKKSSRNSQLSTNDAFEVSFDNLNLNDTADTNKEECDQKPCDSEYVRTTLSDTSRHSQNTNRVNVSQDITSSSITGLDQESSKHSENSCDVKTAVSQIRKVEDKVDSQTFEQRPKGDATIITKQSHTESETNVESLSKTVNPQSCLQRQTSDGAETFHSARASVSDSDIDSGEEEDFEDCNDSPDGSSVASPHLQPRSLFVYGNSPCKTDVDVLRAVGDAPVSPILHPHVFMWKNSVLSTSENSRRSWSVGTPSSAKSHSSSNQNTPRSYRLPQTPNSIGSPSLLQSTLLDDDEPISFSASETESDSSFSSRDSSMRSIRTNLISDFFLKD